MIKAFRLIVQKARYRDVGLWWFLNVKGRGGHPAGGKL